MAQVRKYNWAQVGKISKELEKGHGHDGRPLRYAIRICSFFQLNFQSFKNLIFVSFNSFISYYLFCFFFVVGILRQAFIPSYM